MNFSKATNFIKQDGKVITKSENVERSGGRMNVSNREGYGATRELLRMRF